MVGGSDQYSVGDSVFTGTLVGKNVNVGTAVGTEVGTNDGSLLSVGLRVGSTEIVGKCVGAGEGIDVGAVDGVSVGKMVMFGLYIVGSFDGIAVGTDVGIPVGTAEGLAINVGCAVCGYVGTFHNTVGIGKGPGDGVSVGLTNCTSDRPWVGGGVSEERANGAQLKIKETKKQGRIWRISKQRSIASKLDNKLITGGYSKARFLHPSFFRY